MNKIDISWNTQMIFKFLKNRNAWMALQSLVYMNTISEGRWKKDFILIKPSPTTLLPCFALDYVKEPSKQCSAAQPSWQWHSSVMKRCVGHQMSYTWWYHPTCNAIIWSIVVSVPLKRVNTMDFAASSSSNVIIITWISVLMYYYYFFLFGVWM